MNKRAAMSAFSGNTKTIRKLMFYFRLKYIANIHKNQAFFLSMNKKASIVNFGMPLKLL